MATVRQHARARRSYTSRAAREELRLAAAAAFHHLDDPIFLSESPLAGLSIVQERSAMCKRLFAEGWVLQALLKDVAKEIASGLGHEGKMRLIRVALEGASEGESVSAMARRSGLRRETFSRHYWRIASGLVADELLRRSGLDRR